jgi:cbb3-type cytochrome oxidase maturation protein
VDSLYILIPVALIFVAIGIKLLLWAIDNGQYDDLDKEAWRILADDSAPKTDPEKKKPEKGSA